MCKVPEVMSRLCRCGRAPETATHLVLHCAELTDQRRALDAVLGRPLRTCRGDLADATREKAMAATIVRWLLKLERLQEYKLVQRIVAMADEKVGGDTEGRGCQDRNRPERGPSCRVAARPGGAVPAHL